MGLWSDEILDKKCDFQVRLHHRALCSSHTLVLCTGLMNELAKQNLLGNGQSSLPATAGLDPSVCFHVAPYTENLLQMLGR